jgi:hypothetical protein
MVSPVQLVRTRANANIVKNINRSEMQKDGRDVERA